MKTSRFLAILFVLVLFTVAHAQSTAFTYQGKLNDGAVAASGPYDFQFALYDAASGGTQVGTLNVRGDVNVAGGIFTVQLDFGRTPFTSAGDRFLEIAVRPGASTGVYTTLAPRQPITNAPYAIKSGTADVATTAANADALGGFAAENFIQTTDPRLSDARPPLAGSFNYIQNSTAQQPLASFNVGGNGTVSGTLAGGTVRASSHFEIGSNRILSAPGTDNLFAGRLSGINNSSGLFNSFFGFRAGEANAGGSSNSFFGERSGLNSQGVNNTFLGAVAGQTNTTGSNNTAIGTLADVVSPNLTFATAIGAGAVVDGSNKIQLGRTSGADTVFSPGPLVAQSFSGSGALLTQINGANIQVGSIRSAALSSEILPNRGPLNNLALLRWDLVKPKFPSGSGFFGAFDGTNIWVGNYTGNQVWKFRAEDGTLQSQITVGSNPIAVAFDGLNIWTTNQGSRNVSKVRASDGAILGTFDTDGLAPQGIAFDGTNIWVTIGSAAVRKLSASDGSTIGTYVVGNDPYAIAFDGSNIWVTNFASSNVTKLRASDGSVLGTFAVPANPTGIAFDGGNVWVANGSRISKLRAFDGSNLGNFTLPFGALGVAFDGTNIWTTTADGSVLKIRPGDGVILGSFAVDTSPKGVVFDGNSIWVLDALGSITKVPIFK